MTPSSCSTALAPRPYLMSTSTSVSASMIEGSSSSCGASLTGGGRVISGGSSKTAAGSSVVNSCTGGVPDGFVAAGAADSSANSCTGGVPDAFVAAGAADSSLSFSLTSERSGATMPAFASTSRASSGLPRAMRASAACTSSCAPSDARPSLEKSSARAEAPATGSCVTAMKSFRMAAAPPKSTFSALCSARTTACFSALSYSFLVI